MAVDGLHDLPDEVPSLTDKQGKLKMSYHSPNKAPSYLTIRPVRIEQDELKFDN